MSKVLKFIVHFVVICTILCVVALAVPPFFGVTTQIQDDATIRSNLPVGSVTYAIPVKAEEIQIGDSILVTEEPSVYRYNIASLDTSSGNGTVVDPSVTNSAPIKVAFGDYLPKVIIQVPFIGYLLKATQSLEGLVILGLVVLFLIILYVIAELWKPKADDDDEDEDADYYPEDTAPGYIKSRKELRQEDKERKRALSRQDEQAREEERYRRRSRNSSSRNKAKIRTGGFVDEVDESDFDDGYDDDDDIYNATSEAHEVLRQGVAEVTREGDEADEMDYYEDEVPEQDPTLEVKRRRAEAKANRQSSSSRKARPQKRKPSRKVEEEDAYDDYDDEEEEPEEVREPAPRERKAAAIPRYSATQLERKAKKEGDDPLVNTDSVMGVTEFDYSDILFDDGESPLDEDDDF